MWLCEVSRVPQDHIQEHINLIARHEQEFLTKRSAAERVSDSLARFAGSFAFVCVHLVLFVAWMAVNSLTIVRIRHFDPEPFSLMATVVALEAILLASIILMRQTRMSRRADERDHLMLQILLLTEKENTAILGIAREIAQRAGLKSAVNNEEIDQLTQTTSIDDVAHGIKETFPSE
jgi:uncharacterized membrane protein